MRRVFGIVAVALLALPATASATWSVIAVDRSTGRVVIASATCVDRDDRFLMGVQAVVVPGKGVAACQAAVDGTHANQMLVFEELQKGTDPRDRRDAQPRIRRSRGGSSAFSICRAAAPGTRASTNGYVSQDMQGQVPGTEIYYSIQGNILRPGDVVPNAVQAFIADDGRDHRSRDGGDRSGRRGPAATAVAAARRAGRRSKPPIPCDGKTSHVAYILMAEKKDTNGDSHNNGRYAMYLTVVAARARQARTQSARART